MCGSGDSGIPAVSLYCLSPAAAAGESVEEINGAEEIFLGLRGAKPILMQVDLYSISFV